VKKNKKKKEKKELLHHFPYKYPSVSLISHNDFESDYYYRDLEMFRTN